MRFMGLLQFVVGTRVAVILLFWFPLSLEAFSHVRPSIYNGSAKRSPLLSWSSSTGVIAKKRSTAMTTTTSSSPLTTKTQPIIPSFQPPSNPTTYYDAIIAGGGPAGLLAAIMLTQKYGPAYKIAVCEKRPSLPPSPYDETVWEDVARFYLLGIGHRGQSAMQQFGLLEEFCNVSVQVDGRRDWQPGKTKLEDGRITPANKDPPSRILARDKLVGLFHEYLVRNYLTINAENDGIEEPQQSQQKASAIDLLYGYEVEPISFGDSTNDTVTVRITKCEDVPNIPTEASMEDGSVSTTSYAASQDSQQVFNVGDYVEATTSFLIGADGASRTVARAMEKADAERFQKLNIFQKLLFFKKKFRVKRFIDDNPRVYKSVPILLPPDWPQRLNYSARSRNSRITLEALPSDEKGNMCALLLMKPDDELAQSNVDPQKLRQFFDEEFPQFGALVDDDEMARIAQKPASRLPVFRYAGPRLNMGRRTLVLGDAAHTVKPYYGLGANTALEDVQILSDILDEMERCSTNANEDVIPAAVQRFSDRRSGDAEALVTISRNIDRPGKMFFFSFLLPIILDGIFHKLAPNIFGPNIFFMFKQKNIGFKQIQRKKRLDRTIQLVLLGALAAGVFSIARAFVGLLSQVIGKSHGFVHRSFFAAVAVVTILRRTLLQRKNRKGGTETAP